MSQRNSAAKEKLQKNAAASETSHRDSLAGETPMAGNSDKPQINSTSGETAQRDSSANEAPQRNSAATDMSNRNSASCRNSVRRESPRENSAQSETSHRNCPESERPRGKFVEQCTEDVLSILCPSEASDDISTCVSQTRIDPDRNDFDRVPSRSRTNADQNILTDLSAGVLMDTPDAIAREDSDVAEQMTSSTMAKIGYDDRKRLATDCSSYTKTKTGLDNEARTSSDDLEKCCHDNGSSLHYVTDSTLEELASHTYVVRKNGTFSNLPFSSRVGAQNPTPGVQNSISVTPEGEDGEGGIPETLGRKISPIDPDSNTASVFSQKDDCAEKREGSQTVHSQTVHSQTVHSQTVPLQSVFSQAVPSLAIPPRETHSKRSGSGSRKNSAIQNKTSLMSENVPNEKSENLKADIANSGYSTYPGSRVEFNSKVDSKADLGAKNKAGSSKPKPDKLKDIRRNVDLFTDILYKTVIDKTKKKSKRSRRVTLHDFFFQVKREVQKLQEDLQLEDYSVPVTNPLHSKSVTSMARLEPGKSPVQKAISQNSLKPSGDNKVDISGDQSETTKSEAKSELSDSDGTLKDALASVFDVTNKSGEYDSSSAACFYETDFESSSDDEASSETVLTDEITHVKSEITSVKQSNIETVKKDKSVNITRSLSDVKQTKRNWKQISEKKSKLVEETVPLTRKERAAFHGSIRARLRRAIAFSDREELESAIRDFRDEQLKDPKGELLVGCRELDAIKTTDSIRDAVQKRNIDRVKYSMGHCERLGQRERLSRDLDKAGRLMESRDRVERLKRSVFDMDSCVFAEIRRYQSPHPVVHRVIRAMLLLLREHEGTTRKWKKCQKFLNTIGPSGLFSRIKQFNVDDLAPEIVSRSRQLVDETSEEEVEEISSGLHIFYKWTRGMVEEYANRNSLADDCRPAQRRRQRVILRAIRQLEDMISAEGQAATKLRRKLDPVVCQQKFIHDARKVAPGPGQMKTGPASKPVIRQVKMKTSPRPGPTKNSLMQEQNRLRTKLALPVLAQFAVLYKNVQKRKDDIASPERTQNAPVKCKQTHMVPLLERRRGNVKSEVPINKGNTVKDAETVYSLKVESQRRTKLSPTAALPAIKR